MMTYERWLKCIVTSAQEIADREYQAESWFGKGERVSSPAELYYGLMEDCTFDLFHETYGKNFSEDQIYCWNELKHLLEQYWRGLPKFPDPYIVFNDPKWQIVRDSASRFVKAFRP